MSGARQTSRTPRIDRQVFDFEVNRLDRVRPMARQHRHQEVEINFLESGRTTYLICGTEAVIRPGRLCLFWGAVPHRVVREDQDDAHGLWYITVPLAWVLSWRLPPAFVGQLLDGRMITDALPRASDRLKLDDWLAASKAPDNSVQRRSAVMEIEARLACLATDSAKGPAGPPALPADVDHVDAMAKFVVEHYTDAVRLSDIAAAVDLNPNYAATLFKLHCGETLLTCVTQHRVMHAQRLLATSDLKMIDIALDSGFASVSRFYEAFSKACQTTPAAYRRRMRPD